MEYIINDLELRHSKELIEQFREVSTPALGDALGRFHCMINMRHFNETGIKMAGTAFTVKTNSGDNLMIHKALELAEAGDIIVVEGDGALNRALIGEIMCLIAQVNGLAGIIIDGAIRDVEEIKEMGFPCFAKASIPAGPRRDGPGQINVAISCAGVPVLPGDLVVGDDNGVIVIPQALVSEELLKEAQAIEEMEENMLTQIKDGSLDRSWVDKALKDKGILKGD